jgi:hypothetical protein
VFNEPINRRLEVVENTAGEVNKAAEAERRIDELRQVGQAALQSWAERRQRVVEQSYRCGRGGQQMRHSERERRSVVVSVRKSSAALACKGTI